MPDPDGRAELPVSCTLGPAGGAERMRRWERLAAAAAPASHLADGRLVVRYQPVPGVLGELRDLAAAEADCCAFAGWTVTEQGGHPTLVVSGEPERIAPIAALFGAASATARGPAG